MLWACAPIFTTYLLIQLADKSEIFFLELYFHGEESSRELGIYAASSKGFQIFLTALTSFTAGLFATIAHFQQSDWERCKRTVHRGLKVLLIVAVVWLTPYEHGHGLGH